MNYLSHFIFYDLLLTHTNTDLSNSYVYTAMQLQSAYYMGVYIVFVNGGFEFLLCEY